MKNTLRGIAAGTVFAVIVMAPKFTRAVATLLGV